MGDFGECIKVSLPWGILATVCLVLLKLGNAQFCNSEHGKVAQRHGADLLCETANMLGEGGGAGRCQNQKLKDSKSKA